ncbi:MAG: MATE family efflux transporter [Anaeroplasmataceae bacterium]
MANMNKMANEPLKKLFWKLGLPMIISMILQALYNVIDSIFVANIEGNGALANEALTYAFPIQILIIAIGVGTGVGLNALLSKSLGEHDKESVNKIAGNGIFLVLVIYIIFLLFGLFGSKPFIKLFTKDEEVIKMGSSYLMICSSLSLGSIGFAIFERFLQSTGKTLFSTIAQISGAVTNIILDYIFIYILDMEVEGAAWATIIGQFVSLIVAMIFHYFKNKEISGKIIYLKPSIRIIKGIYSIGISAALMQALLSVMMAGMNAILKTADVSSTVLVGSFGIYYKIQQIALFSCFGLSNTIITLLSFNYGMKDKNRSKDCIKYGILDTLIVTIIITILFEIMARPLSKLFALSGGSTAELIDVCEMATRIASIGYIFMGFSIAVQGILQALRYAIKPLVTALLRLVVFVFPIAFLFTLSSSVLDVVWWTFPIAEFLTAVISYFILRNVIKNKIDTMQDIKIEGDNLIITISRMHGTNAKVIGRKLAEKLSINFYDKELTMLEALKRGLNKEYLSEEIDDYALYLSLDANKESIIAQREIIEDLANKESFVIIGRSADYILRNHKKLVTVFLYADIEYRVKNVMNNYNDTYADALENINKSDKSRSNYYSIIANRPWGDKSNYDLYIDASLGEDEIIEQITNYINNKF